MSGKRGARPDTIVRMDNNGQILLACSTPKTTEQLQSLGIKFQQSQLELLIDWKLLEYGRKEKTYTTTIHVYGPEKAAAIRQRVQSTAADVAAVLNAELLALQSHLGEIGFEKNLFAVLYAYILHDYSMRKLGEEIYQKSQLSEENPFWNGFAWAIYPIQKFDVAVSTLPAKEIRFFFVSAAALPGPEFRELMPFVKDAGADLKVDDPGLIQTFTSFGLCDEKGALTLPIFEGEWPAKLEDMAKKAHAQTVELTESPEMKGILGMATQAQAAMFLHYELRYAVLYHLLETGFMEAPIDFKNAGNNRPADKHRLVFALK